MDEVKYVSYDEFIKLLHSDEFSNEPKEYKDFIADVLKQKRLGNNPSLFIFN